MYPAPGRDVEHLDEPARIVPADGVQVELSVAEFELDVGDRVRPAKRGGADGGRRPRQQLRVGQRCESDLEVRATLLVEGGLVGAASLRHQGDSHGPGCHGEENRQEDDGGLQPPPA
ncbi:MAG: hypothetical protein E6I85_08295 [Chloroflexi bacterium]|nr:MAG: hypothetical protein E6I85_08295 [Chloroflexota bacterium]